MREYFLKERLSLFALRETSHLGPYFGPENRQ